MKQANSTKPWRSPSFNEESSPRSMTPVSDYYLHKRTENVENYLNKFDDRLSTVDLGAKSSQNESSFISQSQKKVTENSRHDNEYRIRAIEDNLLHSKAETSKRIDFLEGQIQELARRISGSGNTRGADIKQEDSVKISGIERRIDVIEKQLSSLSSNFEAFMRKFEGHVPTQQVQQQSSSSPWERSESTKDLRTPETQKSRYGGVPKSSETEYQPPKRTQTRDVRDFDNNRDNLRQSSDVKERLHDPIQHQQRSASDVERQESSAIEYQPPKRTQSRDTRDYSGVKERLQDPIQHQQRSISEFDKQERSQRLEESGGITKSPITEYQPPKRTQSRDTHDYDNTLRQNSGVKDRLRNPLQYQQSSQRLEENEGVTKSSVVEYQPPKRTQSRDTRDNDNNLRQSSGIKHRLQDPIQHQQRSVSDLERQESSVIEYQPPKRTQSRDTRDYSGVKERLHDPLQYQQSSVSGVERQQRSQRLEENEGVSKSSIIEYQPPQRTRDNDNIRDNLRQSFDGKDRRLQDIQDRSQRLEDKINLEVKVSKNALKSGLKSPDTDRRRKSVSWSEECTPQGKGESESGQKRKRQTFNDEAELSQLLETEEKEENSRILHQERERPRTAVKERVQQPEKSFNASYQKGERFGKFSEVLIEDGVEERNSKLTNDREYTDGKSITDMEERRRKIDEEIEKRITKQVEGKKRNEAAIEGQKKLYEKTAQVDEDFKISPFSTEKSRDKEVVARLVREKQMRSELISKYSDSANENYRKSKSPIGGSKH